MGRWIIGYLAAGAAFVALDIGWLRLMTPGVYRPAIGHLLAEQFNSGAAVAFYVLYIAGLVAFGIKPGVDSRSLMAAALWGGAFGLAAYATYDLTNMATLKDWPLKLTLIDMAWGTAASAAASVAGCAALSALSKT